MIADLLALATPAEIAHYRRCLLAQVEAASAESANDFARSLGIEPDPWQDAVLSSEAKRIILNASRQSGKTTTVAIRAMYAALHCPPALVLVLSPSERQSKLFFRRCLEVFRRAGRPVKATVENRLSLELANGSQVVALPGREGTIRGYSGVTMLVVDEAAEVDEELYVAIRPMLAVTDGTLILLSTPKGTRGFFHDVWTRGDPATWDRYEVPATKCPRITAEFLAGERAELGEYYFEQEYMCRFLDPTTASFRAEDVQTLFAEPVEAWTL